MESVTRVGEGACLHIFETGVFLILVAISLIYVFSLLEGRVTTGAVEEGKAHYRGCMRGRWSRAWYLEGGGAGMLYRMDDGEVEEARGAAGRRKRGKEMRSLYRVWRRKRRAEGLGKAGVSEEGDRRGGGGYRSVNQEEGRDSAEGWKRARRQRCYAVRIGIGS